MFRDFSTAIPSATRSWVCSHLINSCHTITLQAWETKINGKIVLSTTVHHSRACISEVLADSSSMVCSKRLGVCTRGSWGCCHHDRIFCRKTCRRNGEWIPNSIGLETRKKTRACTIWNRHICADNLGFPWSQAWWGMHVEKAALCVKLPPHFLCQQTSKWVPGVPLPSAVLEQLLSSDLWEGFVRLTCSRVVASCEPQKGGKQRGFPCLYGISTIQEQ